MQRALAAGRGACAQVLARGGARAGGAAAREGPGGWAPRHWAWGLDPPPPLALAAPGRRGPGAGNPAAGFGWGLLRVAGPARPAAWAAAKANLGRGGAGLRRWLAGLAGRPGGAGTAGLAGAGGGDVEEAWGESDPEFHTKIDVRWRPRLIGKNGARIRKLKERTGARIVFGKGASDGVVYVYGKPEQQRAMWLALQDEIGIERLRDAMERHRVAQRPREVLREWDAARRACADAASPLFIFDYHQALAACIQIFQIHRSMRIFKLMCLDPNVEPTHRTFGFLTRAAVMSGDLNPLLAKLDLAQRHCGVTVEHALREIELSMLELKFPRVKVAMQLLEALIQQGMAPSDKLLNCIFQHHAKREDVFYAEHCLKQLPMEGPKRKPLLDLLAELSLRARALVLSARVQHSFCTTTAPEDSAPDAHFLEEALLCAKFWRRADVAAQVWAVATENQRVIEYGGYADYVKTLAACGAAQEALVVLDEMEIGRRFAVPPALVLQVANEITIGKLRAEHVAEDFVKDIEKGREKVSNASVAVLVLLVGRALNLTKAFQLFEKVLPKLTSKTPSRMVYNALLSNCALHRRLEAARRTISHMQQFGMSPDNDANCYLLQAAVRAKDEDSVWQYAKLLQQETLSPLGRRSRDMVVTYLESCGKHDKAALVKDILGDK